MLKNIAVAAIAALTFISAHAKTTVSIYWPFGFGSNNATAIRNTAQCMNQIQNDYTFVLENKQGAGGTVAVRHVAASQELAILSTSSSYFMRPSFFPDASYDVNSLKPAAILATGQPLLLISGKYKTLDELKAQPKLSIGIDAGTVRQLVGEELKRALPNTDIVLVPHPDSGKSTIDTMTGVLDANVGFIFNAERFKDDERFKALAITGRKNHSVYKTFASQKWAGFEDITMDYWFFVPANTPEADTKKINTAVQECNRRRAAADAWNIDGLDSSPIDFETTNRMFQHQVKFWPNLKVKLIGK